MDVERQTHVVPHEVREVCGAPEQARHVEAGQQFGQLFGLEERPVTPHRDDVACRDGGVVSVPSVSVAVPEPPGFANCTDVPW